jgi:hypothetical protein
VHICEEWHTRNTQRQVESHCKIPFSARQHHQSEESAFKTFIKMENSDSNTMVPHLDSIRAATAPSNATTIIEVKESHPMALQQLQGSHHSSLSSTSAACRCCTDDNVSLDALKKQYEERLNESRKRIEELQKSLEVIFSLPSSFSFFIAFRTLISKSPRRSRATRTE